MTQFEVFANPVVRARPSYPFVVVLQADVARGGHERAVAPVAPRAAFPAISGRLTPIMTIERDEFVLGDVPDHHSGAEFWSSHLFFCRSP